MVRDVLIPELLRVHFAAITAHPVLTLRKGVGARRNTRRKDRLIARLKGGRDAINLDNVDGAPFVDWLLAQHIVSVWGEDAVDGLDVVRPMTVDVHIAVIGHGIVALEPQLDGINVELALFEVVNLLHARRVLCGVGIPEGNGLELRRVAAIHLFPALIGDLILIGIGSGDRRGRARRLAGHVVGLHVVDVQVMEGFVF